VKPPLRHDHLPPKQRSQKGRVEPSPVDDVISVSSAWFLSLEAETWIEYQRMRWIEDPILPAEDWLRKEETSFTNFPPTSSCVVSLRYTVLVPVTMITISGRESVGSEPEYRSEHSH
jgi:hypothetical protein